MSTTFSIWKKKNTCKSNMFDSTNGIQFIISQYRFVFVSWNSYYILYIINLYEFKWLEKSHDKNGAQIFLSKCHLLVYEYDMTKLEENSTINFQTHIFTHNMHERICFCVAFNLTSTWINLFFEYYIYFQFIATESDI